MRKERRSHDTPALEGGLEGSVVASGGRGKAHIRFGSGASGIERLEARFVGQAFAPHRHDTYAIGITLAGIQTFRYRGEQRHCLPGQAHVLHPDELHDGRAATAEGFAYRILYIDPALIQSAVGGAALPFVADPVVRRVQAVGELAQALLEIDSPLEEAAVVDLTASLAAVLAGLSANEGQRTICAAPRLHMPALLRVREAIAARPCVQLVAQDLEQIANLDRWTIARQFRSAFGTSPSRFRTMRQLDLARRLMREGKKMAEISLEVGFADQSHLARMFKRAYGLTPSQWRSAAGGCNVAKSA